MSAVMASEGAWVASDHSTYFNITLGLGVIGLGAFLCILCLAFMRSIKLFGQNRDATFAFSTSLLLLMMINMGLETIWFQPYLSGFLGMIILAKLAMKNQAERAATSHGLFNFHPTASAYKLGSRRDAASKYDR